MKAQIVIGANFGDEGKGMTVDYLASQVDNSIVVRFNGGAQAGHTVENNYMRHVFHHFGSGTLLGRPSFLSKYFVVDPMSFFEERKELLTKGVSPKVFIDTNAPLTTPYDAIINMGIERARGSQRHGSCGYGVGETVERNTSLSNPGFGTTVADIFDVRILKEKLKDIRDHYMPERLKRLGREVRLNKLDMSDYMIDMYIDQCWNMIDHVTTTPSPELLHNYDLVVFEGAQGLLLNEFHRWFPYVTRSRTGIFNAVEILKELGILEAEVFYITRSYLTRHGAGPLPFEVEDKIYPAIVDKTNVPNEFQGTLRFAPFNFDLLEESITNDLDTVSGITLFPNLVVTCINQLSKQVRFVENGIVHTDDDFMFLNKISSFGKFKNVLLSTGRTRNDFG